MSDDKIMLNCELCNRAYQFGPHLYSGKYIRKYELSVCMGCYTVNHDGWAPHLEEKIIKHIENKGLSIPRKNCNGYLPRD